MLAGFTVTELYINSNVKVDTKMEMIVDIDIFTLESIKEKSKELLAERLKVQPSEINVEKELTSYGLDSIDAMTMVGDLEDWLDAELPSTLLWDYSNINDLSAYIAGNLQELRTQVETITESSSYIRSSGNCADASN